MEHETKTIAKSILSLLGHAPWRPDGGYKPFQSRFEHCGHDPSYYFLREKPKLCSRTERSAA